MYNSVEYLRKDREFLERMKEIYEKEVKQLSVAGLSITRRKDQKYFYTYEKGESGKKKYLGTQDNKVVKEIQKQRYLNESLKIIDVNIKEIDHFLSRYKSVNPFEILENLPKAYNPPPEICINQTGVVDVQNWGNLPYPKNEKYQEGLKHTTNKGELVRSKSEVIIANALYTRGIPYRYEQVIDVGGIRIAADFNAWSLISGKYVKWEHFGMMGDSEYRKKALWKIDQYVKEGFTPWKDIIFTFDDLDGNIDALEVNRIIECFFL